MSNPEVFEPKFVKIAENLAGAEGPVFDKNGNFYMVAPECVDAENNAAGEVLKVNLENGQVRFRLYITMITTSDTSKFE